MPCPYDDNRYFNFELNAFGTYLVGIGFDRHNLEFIDEKIIKDIFSVKNKIEKVKRNGEELYKIELEFSIPYKFITKYFENFKPQSNNIIKGNFYKCGDKTLFPHYGCWNNINHTIFDFHRSEFFGTLIFE